MENYELKRLLNEEVKSISPVWLFQERADRLSYTNDVNDEVIGENFIKLYAHSSGKMLEDWYINMEFRKNDIRYELWLDHATDDGIKKLFAEYKRIKGE